MQIIKFTQHVTIFVVTLMLLIGCNYDGPSSSSIEESVNNFNGALLVVTPNNISPLVGATIQLSSQLLHEDGSIDSGSESVHWSVCDDDCAPTRAIATRATVTNTGLVTFLEPGDVTVRASYGTKYNDVKFVVENSSIVSLATSVVGSSTSLLVGQKARLKTIASYDNGRSEEVAVSYQSNNPAISITSDKGAFFAVAKTEGDAEVKAKLGGNDSTPVSFSVTAPAVTHLTATPSFSGGATKFVVGNTAFLKVIASLDDNTSRDVTELVTWVNIDNPDSISIQNSVVTAVKAGSSKWKAQYGGQESELTFTVVDVAYQSISFNLGSAMMSSKTMVLDDVMSLSIVAHSATHGPLHLDLSNVNLKWEATEKNASIQTKVDNSYLQVTAVSEGAGRLIAEYKGLKATLNLTLNPKKVVDSIGISPSSTSIQVASSTSFNVTAIHSDNTINKINSSNVVWSVDDPSVAVISKAGVLTGLTSGQVEVTAKYEEIESTYTMEVTAKPADIVRIRMDGRDYNNLTQYEVFRIEPIAVRSDGTEFAINKQEVLVQDPSNILKSKVHHDVVTDNRLPIYFLDEVSKPTTITVSWNGYQVEQTVEATIPLDTTNVFLHRCPSVLRHGEVSEVGCRPMQNNNGTNVELIIDHISTSSPNLVAKIRPAGLPGFASIGNAMNDISVQLSPNFLENFVDGAKFTFSVCLPTADCFEQEVTASSENRQWNGFTYLCYSNGVNNTVHNLKVGEEKAFYIYVMSDNSCVWGDDIETSWYEENTDIGVVDRSIKSGARNMGFKAKSVGTTKVHFSAVRTSDGQSDQVTYTFNVTN